jgi:hypothetical protein
MHSVGPRGDVSRSPFWSNVVVKVLPSLDRFSGGIVPFVESGGQCLSLSYGAMKSDRQDVLEQFDCSFCVGFPSCLSDKAFEEGDGCVDLIHV